MSHPVLQAGQHAELDAALEAAASAATPVYVLFPGAGAASVSEVACASKHRRCLKQAPLPVLDTHPGPHALEGDATPGGAPNAVAPGALSLPGPAHAAESPPARGSHPAYWLIALDGTWQQANEMFQVPPALACLRGACKPCTTHASLPELVVPLAVPLLRSVQLPMDAGQHASTEGSASPYAWKPMQCEQILGLLPCIVAAGSSARSAGARHPRGAPA